MRKKAITEKASVEMPEERELEVADALLELSRGRGLLPGKYLSSIRRKRDISHIADCESGSHRRQGVTVLRMDDKLNAKASKGLNIRFVMGNSSGKDHKRRRFEEDDLSMFSDKVGDKDTHPYKDHELCDSHEVNRILCRKSKKNVDVRVTVKQKYCRMKHLRNRAEGNWQRTSFEPHSCISDHNDLCDSPMLIDKCITTKKKLNSVRNGFDPILSSESIPKGKVRPLLKPRKRQPSTSITPLQHPGFSFSIIHLLCAVRIALITQESYLNSGHDVKESYKGEKHMTDICSEAPERSFGVHKDENGIIISDGSVQKNSSSRTTDEIVHWVKLNPGDGRIFELNMPLQDLVRGVLKIFTSKTAPAGATPWKALAVYDKISKTWSWTGPLPSRLPHTFSVKEQISPEDWGVPRRILAKLVDSFAHWLKAYQEVLKKIQSLPPPPLTLMQCSSINERFNDKRARKSLLTLTPSCEEVRAYFRREEALRYSIPQHTFSYTALDGRKSTVAPLVRCSGKPASRIRDHFILKQDRPPQFTVLCLVRDAAARLPGRLGTRLDICTLVRDSQFIFEEASDLEISQVTSGALDRLHYEVDPCVRFHKGWRLWVYLHGDREEEDFDQDCTTSRKVRKKEIEKLSGKQIPDKEAIQQTSIDREAP